MALPGGTFDVREYNYRIPSQNLGMGLCRILILLDGDPTILLPGVFTMGCGSLRMPSLRTRNRPLTKPWEWNAPGTLCLCLRRKCFPGLSLRNIPEGYHKCQHDP